MVCGKNLICGTSYFGVRNIRHVACDMQELKNAGFTHVLHTYSEEDLQYYRETMKEIIEIYTKSKTFNNIAEIMKEVERIRTKVDMTSFEEMAFS